MKIVNDYEWSTHIPLNQAIVEVMQPKLIVELGTGLHSTPIFLKSTAEKLYFIDNDANWLNEIKKNNQFDDRCTIMHHDLGSEIHLTTFLRELSQEKRNEITNYYKELSKTITSIDVKPKMLFVDHYTCARALSINTLYKDFDLVLYHDCQPKGTKWYEYYFESDLYKNYDSYFLRSPTSWTGCFVKKEYDIEISLRTIITPFIKKYCEENNLALSDMFLEKK